MNEQLRFSWGHIIAFMALIIISYITFAGTSYMTDGDFTKASVAMAAIDVALFVFFIGAQLMKATTKRFSRRIWVERVFVFGSPIVFFLCMIPYYHFGTVQSHDDEIVGHFTGAISASKQMFSDYDAYSKKRISNYEHMLDSVINNQSIQPGEFTSCGFTKGREQIQKDNMVRALQLQLISANYDSLKNVATKWLESSSKGASTWNVFLLGNTKEIKKAIHEWSDQLAEFSKHKMTNEEFNGYNQVKNFSEVSKSLSSVDSCLDGLTKKFTNAAFPPVGYILGSFVLYFALLFPYILQERYTKSLFRLLGIRSSSITNEPSKPIIEGEESVVESYEEDGGSITTKSKADEADDDDDDYKSFTI